MTNGIYAGVAAIKFSDDFLNLVLDVKFNDAHYSHMSDQATNLPTLETETCSRCGGTGHYSYCQRFGTTCFKCSGHKIVYTKRGAAAALYLYNLLSVPVSELKPGMKVKEHRISNDGQILAAEWFTVREITPNTTCGRYVGEGEARHVEYSGVTVVTDKITFAGIAPDTMYRVAVSKEVKAEALRKAVEYQNTLTKQGKPRKVKK